MITYPMFHSSPLTFCQSNPVNFQERDINVDYPLIRSLLKQREATLFT
jgi:hypothetical protein